MSLQEGNCKAWGPWEEGPQRPAPPPPQSQGCRQTLRLIQDTARTRRRRSLTGAPRTRRLEVGFKGTSVAALRWKEYPCPVPCSLPHTFPKSLHTARNLLTKINWGADPGPSGAPGRQLPKWGSHLRQGSSRQGTHTHPTLNTLIQRRAFPRRAPLPFPGLRFWSMKTLSSPLASIRPACGGNDNTVSRRGERGSPSSNPPLAHLATHLKGPRRPHAAARPGGTSWLTHHDRLSAAGKGSCQPLKLSLWDTVQHFPQLSTKSHGTSHLGSAMRNHGWATGKANWCSGPRTAPLVLLERRTPRSQHQDRPFLCMGGVGLGPGARPSPPFTATGCTQHPPAPPSSQGDQRGTGRHLMVKRVWGTSTMGRLNERSMCPTRATTEGSEHHPNCHGDGLG